MNSIFHCYVFFPFHKPLQGLFHYEDFLRFSSKIGENFVRLKLPNPLAHDIQNISFLNVTFFSPTTVSRMHPIVHYRANKNKWMLFRHVSLKRWGWTLRRGTFSSTSTLSSLKKCFYRIILMFTQCWLFVSHQPQKKRCGVFAWCLSISAGKQCKLFLCWFFLAFCLPRAWVREEKSLSEWIKNCVVKTATECEIKTNTTSTASTVLPDQWNHPTVLKSSVNFCWFIHFVFLRKLITLLRFLIHEFMNFSFRPSTPSHSHLNFN